MQYHGLSVATKGPCSIYQYSYMTPRLSGQSCTIFTGVCFVSQFTRDLDTKETTPNIELCPGSLGAMSEY